MNTLKFLGASGMVTGSGYFLADEETDRGVLIDLGMFQGLKEVVALNYKPLEVDINKIDGVLVTHAHLDHCGRLPMLIRKGYRGSIFMTEATRMLAELTMYDTAKIAKEGKDGPPLYDELDVEQTLAQIQLVIYHQKLRVGKFEVEFIDAGHILGAASIIIHDSTAPEGAQSYVFSGDIGNFPEPIVKTTEFAPQADIVVMESTYGDRLHPEEDAAKIVQEEINIIENNNAVLLIPAFSVEKTQELINMIGHLKKEGKIRYSTPVYVDSPMGIRATDIYRQFNELFNEKLYAESQKGDPFYFPGLSMVLKGSKSKKIRHVQGAKVIIAGGGMMTGGRILQHAADVLSKPSTRLLIVGYQGEETLGREIEEGASVVSIKGREVPVRAHISRITGMSSHADQSQLLQWLQNIKGVKKVFISHGEDSSRIAFKEKIEQETKIKDVILPTVNQQFKLS